MERVVSFLSGSPSYNTELALNVGFFQNLSVVPSYAAIRTGQRRLKCQKVG